MIPKSGSRFSGKIMLKKCPRSHTYDDAQVALAGIAEHFERGLIARAVVRRRGLFDALELDQNGALLEAFFVGFCRGAARQKTAAAGCNRGPRELGVFG